jgi:hypothetical protein
LQETANRIDEKRFPVFRAEVQARLGLALEDVAKYKYPENIQARIHYGLIGQVEGNKSETGKRVVYLKAAIDAYQKALRVLTEDSPQLHWAVTQIDLGGAYLALGKQLTGKAVETLPAALTSLEDALRVFTTRELYRQFWAATHANLCEGYRLLSDHLSETEAVGRLQSAVAACNDALRYSRKDPDFG